MPNPLTAPLVQFASRLRFPVLFTITLTLWAITLLVPDPILFLDEIVVGLVTLLFASWKRRRPSEPAPPTGATLEGEARRE